MGIPENAYGFIYITTNTINGKKYIGQKKFDDRGKWETYLGSGVVLKNAVEKYGKENFDRYIVDYAFTSDELNELEYEYTKVLDVVEDDSFYNLVYGGGTVTGLKFSPETLSRLSELASGENNYFYGKRYIGEQNPFYGRKHTLESRNKMSESHKGRKPWNKGRVGVYSEEALLKMRHSKLGKPLSESHKNAIREGVSGENHPMYGKEHSDTTKELIRKKSLGRKVSDDTRKKMSESQKQRYKDHPVRNRKGRPVICITTGEKFDRVKDASEFYQIDVTGISLNCKGKLKTSGQLPDGTRLVWKYLDESTPR